MVSIYFVPGIPVPQGSMRAFAIGEKTVVTSSAKGLSGWRGRMYEVLSRECAGMETGPVRVALRFQLQRPKSISEKKRRYPQVAPDIDKLARAALDAMTGVVYADDAQVCSLAVAKVYADHGQQPGVRIEVEAM